MKNALVIGATGGIGAALSAHMESDGWGVTKWSRASGFDICDEACIQQVVDTCDQTFDLVVIATGILDPDDAPEKSLAAISAERFEQVMRVNALGPALVLKHLRKIIPKKRPARVIVLSARVGSIGDNALGGWYSYRASKAALNQIVRTASVELGRSFPNLCVVSYHPGTVETRFTAKYSDRYLTVPPNEAAKNLGRVIDGLSAKDTGTFIDWAGKSIPW